jgi:hypothetical protein
MDGTIRRIGEARAKDEREAMQRALQEKRSRFRLSARREA